MGLREEAGYPSICSFTQHIYTEVQLCARHRLEPGAALGIRSSLPIREAGDKPENSFGGGGWGVREVSQGDCFVTQAGNWKE